MIIDTITFSGADNSIEPAELLLNIVMWNRNSVQPTIELGILLSAKNMGAPRYPTIEWLDELTKYNSIAHVELAGHMCGAWARDMAAGNFTFADSFPQYWAVFKRIQINLKGYDGLVANTMFDNLKKYGKNKQYIIQMDGLHDWILDECLKQKINVAPLFDQSGGEGKTPAKWPTYNNELIDRIGWAGGLGPDNLTEEINKIAETNKEYSHGIDNWIWVDMESKIRTNDKFDIKKCEQAFTEILANNLCQ